MRTARRGPLRAVARVMLAVLLALGLTVPSTGALAAPGDRYNVYFYADTMALQAGTPAFSSTNLPEGTVINNPGSTVPSTGDTDLRFLGWYVYSSGGPQPPDSQPYDFSQPLMGNLTLVARYHSETLVTFLDGYGKVFLTRQVATNAAVPLPSSTEMQSFTAPSGYHFQSWRYQGADYTGGGFAADATIEPVLSTGSAFVFFVSAGSQVPFQTVNKGSVAAQPAAPTRVGYRFLYWSTTDGGSAFDFSTPVTDDTTLYAVWQAQSVSYTVLFWQEKPDITGDPGTDPLNYQLSYQFTSTALAGSAASSLDVQALIASQSSHAPTYSTYRSHAVSTDTVAGNGSTVVNVYFKRIEYTFTFVLARSDAKLVIGSNTYTDTTPYQFKAKLAQDTTNLWPANIGTVTATNASYLFYGWFPTGGSSTSVSKVFTVSEDLLPKSGTSQTVTARWITSGVQTTLHYMFESLDGNVSGAVTYNGKYYLQSQQYTQSLLSSSSVPMGLKLIDGLTGLTAKSLAKRSTGYVSVTTADIDQYLFYDRNIHRLDFNTNGGTVYRNSGMDYTKIKFGQNLAPFDPDPPVKEIGDGLTYTFEGWYLDAGFRNPFSFATTMKDADIMLFAKWGVSQFSVTVYDDLTRNKPLETLARAQGDYVGDPGRYTTGTAYPGKGTFLGWVVFVGPGATAPLSFDMPVTEDLAVYANWELESYHITYIAGDAMFGTPPTDSNAYVVGTGARIPQTLLIGPVATGFVGWRVVGTTEPLYYPGSFVTVTGDLTLEPVFAPVNPSLVRVTYHANYLAPDMSAFTPPGDATQFLQSGTPLVAPGFRVFNEDVPGTSFHFLGWSTTQLNVPFTTQAIVLYEDGESIPPFATDTDLYAVWGEDGHCLVRFDLGTQGTYPVTTQTLFCVLKGVPLSTSMLYAQPDPTGSPAASYTFTGWEPAYDPTSIVYDDRVYVAQYAYTAPVMPHVPVTPAPTNASVSVAPYTGEYDGQPHAVTYNAGANLQNVEPFYKDPDLASLSWLGGMPSFTDVGDHRVALTFIATGFLPSSRADSYVDITPRPLTAAGTHDDLMVGAAVPDPSEYAVAIGHLVTGETFNANVLSVDTDYRQGDPVGTYHILADPGVFGNYSLGNQGAGLIGGKVVIGTFRVLAAPTGGVLAIAKAPAEDQALNVHEGDRVAYTITVSNTGSGALTDVTVTEGMAGTWSDASGFDLADARQDDNSLHFATVPAKSTWTATYTVIADKGTLASDGETLSNTVTATTTDGNTPGTPGTPVSATNTDVKVHKDKGVLDVEKAPAADQPLDVEAGDEVTYTITVSNTFARDLDEVTVTEGMAGGVWSNAVGFTLPDADDDGMLAADSFTLGFLPIGARWTVDYTVAVGEGTIHNTVTATDTGGDKDSATNSDIIATGDEQPPPAPVPTPASLPASGDASGLLLAYASALLMLLGAALLVARRVRNTRP
ncbi:MAG: InlB B-repeat-containing protein [Coriobacteriales bacterium]|nr:InlB B-repeat-containing protein [Coriobacteriales bacterium]